VPMADGLLHPVVLFHVPIQAAGTSIAELFELCGGDGSPGSVTLLGYDWEYLQPLREGVEYRADGGIVEADEALGDVAFRIELTDPDGVLAARVTNRWRFRRAGTAPHAPPPPAALGRGEPIPSLVVDDVGADRMKTMAALLRDPYPIHWDVEAVRAAGHGDRPVNQGPLNLGYVANMLMAWAGDASIRRLTVAFHARVFAGDTVVASGQVLGSSRCAVRLMRGDDVIVSGTAEVLAG
jgi:acyl dehydratase